MSLLDEWERDRRNEEARLREQGRSEVMGLAARVVMAAGGSVTLTPDLLAMDDVDLWLTRTFDLDGGYTVTVTHRPR